MKRAAWIWLAASVCAVAGCDEARDAEDGGSDAGRQQDSGPVASCEGASDGTACIGGMICLAQSCVASTCGDRYIDSARGEQCDDGNAIADDGCQPATCTFTCDSDTACDDGFVCDGAETCTAGHVCADGTSAADGTPCSTTDVPSGVCHPLPMPVCLAAECGNGMLDAEEQCDDGRNGDATDGCGDDCQFTCAGTETGCTLTAMPAAHDFGMLAEGMMSSEQTFTIQNVSASPTSTTLTVSLAGPNADNFTIVTNNCMIVLGPFLTCTVTVRFDPVGAGMRQAMLLFAGAAGEAGAAELRGFAIGENGRGCTAGSECQSGDCVDGFCCNESSSTCNGCRACSVAGSEGACADVPAGEDPHGACAGVVCSNETCNGANACAPGMTGTVCQLDSCSIAQVGPGARRAPALTVHVCNGTTTGCPATTTIRECPNGYVCADATTCRTSCTSDQDCVGGYYCDGAACIPGRALGAACTRDRECQLAVCDGGMCRRCRLGQSNEAPNIWVCIPTADGYNTPVDCTAEAMPNVACIQAGVGDTCNNTGSYYDSCTCSSHSQCTTTAAPRCLTGTYGAACACVIRNRTSQVPMDTIVYACPATRRICVAPGTTTSTEGAAFTTVFYEACKGAAGQYCTMNADCASGSCLNSVCQ